MNKRLFTVLAVSALTLGALAQNKWEMGDPSKEGYEYLKEYGNLKDYIDYEKYPNFKLGVGTGAADYNNKGLVYKLTNANFTETVAGNAMKMASCVSSTSSMNFTTVKNYVNNATAAGLNVYGHTLAWHSQQPKGWLLSLLKDKPAEPIEGADTPVYTDLVTKDFRTSQSIGWHSDFSQYGFSVSYDDTDGLKVHCTKKCSQNYEVQYIAMDGISAEKGNTYKMIMTVKGSVAGYLTAKLGDWSSGPTKNINFTTEWQDIEVEYNNTVTNPFLLLQHGLFVGDIYIKKITIQEIVMGKTVNEDRRCLVIETEPQTSSAAETQLFLKVGEFKSGASYSFSALVRADEDATIETQVNGGTLNPIGTYTFSPAWRTIASSGSLNASGSTIMFNLAELGESNRYFFDDISLIIDGEERLVNGNFEGDDLTSFRVKSNGGRAKEPTISEQITYLLVPSPTPLTMEEKHDTLVWAMDKWINGMMTACAGKVKAWDLVNEAISGGGDDGQGNYNLQHSEGYNPSGTWDVGGDAFYWQDYMGDLEYVRQACRLARKYGPEDIKLFINDYNLESTWDGNKKVKSLINWIKKWESDGVTYIDGIGTQMHISYYLDPESQANQERCITTMFELMAASGKLVRVSELDMGICDRQFGTSIKTADVTEEQHKLMADYYKWIYQQYLTIIPPEQQWGICQWCSTDAPSSSGWRGGEPVGYWDLNYYRKHTYAGVCEGLGGVNITGIENVEASVKKDNVIYDLQGRKIENPGRGIYIINGKKVIF